MSRHIRLLGVFFVFSILACYGQTTGASLQGHVTDRAGATVDQLKVVVRSVATGGEWTPAIDKRGNYRLPLLPPGNYDLEASAPGFVNWRKGLQLTVGQAAVLDIQLAPDTAKASEAESAVQISADSYKLNLTTGALSEVVDDTQIRELPLNGRSFQQLAALQPGIIPALAAGNDAAGGRTPKLSINGARPNGNSVLLDGTDMRPPLGKTPGSVAGVLLGVDSVMEFRVMTNAYGAEYGRAVGGVLHAVTRWGENGFHGSAFEFLRNSRFDAKNFFDKANTPIPDFKRNQFGGTVSGPIVREKAFFFAGYEALIEKLGVTGVANVPDADARNGVIGGRTIPVNPVIPSYLNTFFPLPNGPSIGNGVGTYLFSRTQPTNDQMLFGRFDRRFSNNDTFFARYSIDNATVDRQPVNKPPVSYTAERSRNQYVTAELQHLLSPTLLNMTRLGFSRTVMEAGTQRTIDIAQSLSFVPGEPFGNITIAGMVTQVAGDNLLPRRDHFNNYQIENSLLYTRGAHIIRFGAQLERMQLNQTAVSELGGLVTFGSLENFLRGVPQQVDVKLPGYEIPNRGFRQWEFGAFVQDDARLRQNLTLNLGMRYEFVSVPSEVNGKITSLRNVMDPAMTVGGPWFANPTFKNFAPRVGLAWDPFGKKTTAVRAGFGIFYDEPLERSLYYAGTSNPPFFVRSSIANPPFPNVLANFDASTVRPLVSSVEYRIQSPYMMQFNLGIQRLLPAGFSLTASYVGSRGIHLFRIGDANLAPSTMVNGVKTFQPQLGRRNPNFSAIMQRKTDAQSFYNALQISAVKRMGSGVRAQLSYTFSKSIDEASGMDSPDFDNSTQYTMDWYERRLDRGLSSFDARHNLTMNWTVKLPFARSARGLSAVLFRGWEVHNITTYQSGHPFTVRLGFNGSGSLNTTSFAIADRPNVKAGRSNNPILGTPDRWWEISAFELAPANTRGNLGRNTLIGPSMLMADLAFVKSLFQTERTRLQFRGEIFNAPNRPNFADPSGRVSFTSAAGGTAANWGAITSTVTTSRQIQLGMKWMF